MSANDMIITFEDLKNSKYKYDKNVYYDLLKTKEQQDEFKKNYGETITMHFDKLHKIRLPNYIYSDAFFDFDISKPTRFRCKAALALEGENFVNVAVTVFVNTVGLNVNQYEEFQRNILLRRKDFAVALLSCILTNTSIDEHPIIKDKINDVVYSIDTTNKIVPYNTSYDKLKCVIINDLDNEIVEVANKFFVNVENDNVIITLLDAHGIIESKDDVLHLGVFNDNGLIGIYNISVKNYSSNSEHVFLLKKRDYNETIESAFKNIVIPMLKETGDNFINYFNNKEQKVNVFVDSLFW